MSAPPADAETFLAETDRIADLRPDLALLEAGILAGLRLGLAADSLTFARVFGIAHALVLRALATLAGPAALLAVSDRDARTQRTRYAVSATGAALLARLDG
ncbi:hypothetical protein J2X36_003688 [Methylobacterium sp. BE186]|uniref:hypothetical protein n=1 Tax=Methylobacterium sp. BE186 TaxID=2817715 RepID=UPI00285C4762|nr:hypothetical protein [Methylobacterium sp. BE186]MDR7038916.1 hypothetical protein [Methylobacterium sp. BE186]